jgi:hypothetical protein
MTTLLQRIRFAILPPKRSVFVGGRWIPVDPLYPGPATARFADEDVPAWWILGCLRNATYVGRSWRPNGSLRADCEERYAASAQQEQGAGLGKEVHRKRRARGHDPRQ